MNKQKIRISYKTISEPRVLAFLIMLSVIVLNRNMYHAALAFVIIPTVFSICLCILPLVNGIDPKAIIPYIPIILLTSVALISTICSDVVAWSTTTTAMIISTLLYILLTSRNYSCESIRLILHYYALLTVILSIIMLLNLALNYNVYNARVSIKIFGVRKDENYLAAFLVFGFFYYLTSFVFKTKKVSYLLLSMTVFTACYLTGSRGALVAMLGLTLVLILSFIFREGFSVKTFVFGIVMTILVSLAYLFIQKTALFQRMSNINGYKDNIRIVIWGYAIEGFQKRPLIGSGINSGSYYSLQHLRWVTHSCFIDMITSVGIIGTSLYSYAIFNFIHSAGKKLEKNYTMIVGLIVILFTPLMFINGFESPTFWVPMALCKIVSDYCKDNSFSDLLI